MLKRAIVESDKTGEGRKKNSEPSSSDLISWLSDPNIFTLSELGVIAFDLSIPIDTADSQKTLASKIVFWVLSEGKLSTFIKRVFRDRPYLKESEYPKQFPPEVKIQLAMLFTAEFVYLKQDNLEILCQDLGIPGELGGSNYYYEQVVGVLGAIERRNLTQTVPVQKIICTLKKRARAVEVFKPKPMKISRRIPEQPSPQLEIKVMHLLRTFSSADLNLIINQYDFTCRAVNGLTTLQQVFLIFEYAQNTGTFRQLIAAIYTIFPNIDFSEFGLEPVIRQPKEVRGLRQKENSKQFPHTLPQKAVDGLGMYLRELTTQQQVRSQQFIQIATILGYETNFDYPRLAGPLLVETANTRSEIHLLLMAFEQVVGKNVPADKYQKTL